jgi:hypothetical protein
MSRVMIKTSLLLVAVIAATVHADDAADCKKGDNHACARIGRLKQLGALKPDGTKDVDVLITKCGAAADAAKSASDISSIARPCAQLYNAEMQKAWDIMGEIPASDLGPMLATAFGESYCPVLTGKVAGCNGKKSLNFSNAKPDAVRAAIIAINGAALAKELGADKGKALTAKFDAAWPKLLK